MQCPGPHSGCRVVLGLQSKQGISLPQHFFQFSSPPRLALPGIAQHLVRPARGASNGVAAGVTAVSCPRGVDCKLSLSSWEPYSGMGGSLLSFSWGSSLDTGPVGMFSRIGVQCALLPSRPYYERLLRRGGKASLAAIVLQHCGVSAIHLDCCHVLQQALRPRPLWLFGLACSIGLGFPPLPLLASGSRGEVRCLPSQFPHRQVNALGAGLALLKCNVGSIWVPRRGSFSPWIGCRVGEASHPGPVMPGQSLTVAVVNPTAVLNKEKLFKQVNAQVILASESSATAHVQAIMSPRFRREGFKSFWGEPVPEQQTVASGHCLRGLAAGTAVFSSVPARTSVVPFPAEQQQSCRISECFVRLQAIELRVLVVYGFPSCHANAAAKTNMLLSWAYQRATANQVPTLIGGDMNAQPQQLPIWSAFQQQGWVEIGEFMQSVHNTKLPPTCKGATSPDTLLVPPCLQQFLQGADVLTGSGLFDAHEPLRVHFRFPQGHLQTLQWRMPKSWVEFEDDPGRLEAPYEQRRTAVLQAASLLSDQSGTEPCDQTAFGRSLQVWSSVVEDAVSQVVTAKAKAEPHLEWPAGLPRAFRGRCVARVRQARHQPRLPRQGRHGQPNPQCEATSVKARHKLRQCRRLHVLHQGCLKLEGLSPLPNTQQLRQCLVEQWRAVCRAAGYGVPFLNWALSWPEVDCLPLGLPSAAQVGLLLQLTKFDQQAHAQAEATVRRQRFRYQVEVEATEKGAGPSFSRIKPLPPEPLMWYKNCKNAKQRRFPGHHGTAALMRHRGQIICFCIKKCRFWAQ